MLACIVLLRILAAAFSYAYGTLTLYGRTSQILRLPVSAAFASPATPNTVASGLGFSAFARHYSQNLLFSSSYLDVSVRTVPLPHPNGMTALEHRRVSPFGHLRLTRSYTPHRSFSQYNTSFIGTRCLGIHCVPLIAFRTIVRSRRLSWHARLGITFALIIQLLRRTRRTSRTASDSLRHLYHRSKGEFSSHFMSRARSQTGIFAE